MTRVLLLAGLLAGGAIATTAQTPAAAPVAPELAAAQEASRAYAVTYYAGQSWLGVGLADLDKSSQDHLHLASLDGAEVVEVYADSAAAAAGMKDHDVITGFDGQAVRGVRQLERLVNETPADRTVVVRLMRDGKPVEAHVHLEGRPGPRRLSGAWQVLPRGDYAPRVAPMPPMPPAPPLAPLAPMPPIAPMPPTPPRAPLAMVHPMLWGSGRIAMYTGEMGLGLETLSPQLASYFGLPAGEAGLLVRSVEADSAAAKAGFAAGDVVTEIGSTKVGDVSNFEGAIREHAGQTVSATVWRKHAHTTLQLTVPSTRYSR